MISNCNYSLNSNDKINLDYDSTYASIKNYFSVIRKALEHSSEVASLKIGKNVFKTHKINSKFSSLNVIDKLFNNLSLKIYTDNFQGKIPVSGIKESEYNQIKSFFIKVISGHANIKIDETSSEKFRRSVLIDIMILLSKPTSRALLLKLDNFKKVVDIKKGSNPSYNYKSKILKLSLNKISSVVAKTSTNKGFLAPQPRFIILGHELIHFYQHCLYGKKMMKKYEREQLSLKSRFPNLLEKYAIEGKTNGLYPTLSINEKNICKDFKLPKRNNHQGNLFSSNMPLDQKIYFFSTPFYFAAQMGANMDIINYFKNGGNFHRILEKEFIIRDLLHDKNKYDVKKNEETIFLLISYGFPFDNISYKDKLLLLHMATKRNLLVVCEQLLEKSSQIASRDQTKMMQAAIRSKNEELIGLLLKYFEHQ